MPNVTHLTDFNDSTKWTILGDETANLANAAADHLTSHGAITFDKVDATGTTTYAGVYRIDLDLNLTAGDIWCSEDRLVVNFYVGALTDIAQLEVRLGSSASNYRSWIIADSSMTASKWQSLSVKLGLSTVAGTGMDPTSITYMAVQVKFDAEDKALAGIKIDSVYLMKNTPTVS